jgi:6,7-dimethyl-8-ribityllumazine synthase
MPQVDEIKRDLNGKDLQIGIVVSRFNEYAGKELYAACLEELKRLGVSEEDITKVTVPGALEIPLALSKLAGTGEYDALIALGAVIKGETYHFELVANESAAGISRVALDYGIPVANGVLTCYNDEQCKERTKLKGTDCAQCAVEMGNLVAEFPSVDDFDDYDDAEESDDN